MFALFSIKKEYLFCIKRLSTSLKLYVLKPKFVVFYKIKFKILKIGQVKNIG